jgi:hypothetical protein
MSGRHHIPLSVERRLLESPRRIAGIDSSGQPVRLGERDSTGRMVGYIDEHGLGWESLSERIVAVYGARLAEAMALPYDNPQRDKLMEEILVDVPDDLISELAREAAGVLWLKEQRPQ